jgi:hypothetical protein
MGRKTKAKKKKSPSIINLNQIYSSIVSASIVASFNQHTREINPISYHLSPEMK